MLGSAGRHGKSLISANYLFARHAVIYLKHLIILSVNSHHFQKPLPDEAGCRAQASHALPTKLGLTTRLRSGSAQAAHAAACSSPCPKARDDGGRQSHGSRVWGDGAGCAGSKPCTFLPRDAPGETGDRDGSQQRHRGADGVSPGTHGGPPTAHGTEGGQTAESKWQAEPAGQAKHLQPRAPQAGRRQIFTPARARGDARYPTDPPGMSLF